MNIPLLLAAAVGGVILVAVTLRWPELTILLLVAVTTGIYDVKRLPYLDLGPISFHISDIILLILLGVLFFRATAIRGFHFSSSSLTAPLLLFMIAVVISILNGIIVYGVKMNTSLRLARTLFHWLAFLPTLYLVKEEKSLRRLILGLEVLTALFLMGAFFPRTFAGLHLFSIKAKALFTAGHSYVGLTRYYLASEPFLYAMIPVTVASLAIRKEGPHWGRLLLLCGLGVWLISSLLRNYWLTLTLALGLLFLILQTDERLRLLRRLYPLLLLGLALLIILQFAQLGSLDISFDVVGDRFLSLLDNPGQNDPSIQFRIFETQQGVRQFAKHPLIGLGLGNSYRQFMTDDRFGSSDLTWYAHNGYLWIGIMMGLVGLVPLLWLCLSYVYSSITSIRRIADPSLRSIYLGFAVAFIGMMLSNIVTPTLVQDRTLTIFPVMMGISGCILRLSTTTNKAPAASHERYRPETLLSEGTA